jgi:hypothetical protein
MAPTIRPDTIDVAPPTTGSWPWRGRPILVRTDRLALVIAAVQGAYLAAAVFPGSFYGDDLPRMSQAARQGLSWDYLTGEVFGHLAPGYRFAFWLQVQVAPLHHGTAATLTVVGQTAVVLGFWLLLRRLVGPRPAALVPLTVYAFSPVLLPAILWWSSAVNLIPAQLALIGGTYAHLAYLGGRERARWGVPVAMVLGLLFWEKTALLLVELPLLTLVLTAGPVRDRIRRLRGMWRLWVFYSHPVWVFLVFFFAAGYGSPSERVGPVDLARFVMTTFSDGVASGLLGGPLQWARVGTYFSVGAPSPWFAATASAAVVGFLIVCVARNGRRAALAALLLAVPLLASCASTAFSRYAFFGLSVARDYRYVADLLVPTLLALTLAALRPSPDLVGSTPDPEPNRQVRVGAARLVTAVAVVVAVFLAGSALSAYRYTRVWHENPVGDYLAAARRSLEVQPDAPTPGLYDLEVPDYILGQVYWPDNHASRVLAPLRTQPGYDQPGLLGVLDDRGNATSAVLDQESVSAPGPDGDCGWWAPDGDVTVGLLRATPTRDWTVTVYYLATADTPVTIQTRNMRARTDVFSSHAPLQLRSGLNTLIVQAPDRSLDAVDFSEMSADVCVIKIEVAAVIVGDPGAAQP